MSQANDTRVYFITGGASGIGLSVVNELLKRPGTKVAAADINADALEAQAKANNWDRERVSLQKLDVSSWSNWQSAVQSTVERFGRLDIMMNIAGVMIPGYLVDFEEKHVNLTLDINAKGVIFGTKAAALQMQKQNGGHIVNVASIAGLTYNPGASLYCASKHAVRGFSISVASELKKFNTTITVVCPGAVRTPMYEQQKAQEEAALTFTTNLLEPEDITAVLVGEAIEKKPLQMVLPTSDGIKAKIASVFPGLVTKVIDKVVAEGVKKQQSLKKS